MSTVTHQLSGTRAATPARQTFGRVVRSEWIKLRTLTSTWIGVGAVVVLFVGVAAIAAATAEPGLGSGDGVQTVLAGADLAGLVIGVIGSLAGAREYGSRMVSTTFAAVPRRGSVVAAKAIVLGAVLAVTSLVAVLLAFTVGAVVLSGTNAGSLSLLDDLGDLLGMAGYLTALGLLGLGAGILLRNVAGAVGAIVAGILIVPGLAAGLLPESVQPVLELLPTSAAAAFTTVRAAGDDVLGAVAGALVLVAWVLAAVGGAALATERRDV
ncbi:MAG TPA: ABC transporter permease [Cellulomonas sp.]